MLGLELLALTAEQLHGLGLADRLLHEHGFLVRQLAHLLLDLLQVLVREAVLCVEVVIEAVLNGRPKGELGARPEVLDGFGHEVRGAVPDPVQALLFLGSFGTFCDDRHVGGGNMANDRPHGKGQATR